MTFLLARGAWFLSETFGCAYCICLALIPKLPLVFLAIIPHLSHIDLTWRKGTRPLRRALQMTKQVSISIYYYIDN